MNTMRTEIDADTPWFKQWMVWMVITPPVTAIIAGVITISLAIKSDDGLVVDDYYKQGLGINQTLQRDQLARDLKLQADVFFEGSIVKMRLEGSSAGDSFVLHFIHPTQSQRDVKIIMKSISENTYQASMGEVLTGNWNLLLEPVEASWRISGRINFQEKTSSTLLPNLK